MIRRYTRFAVFLATAGITTALLWRSLAVAPALLAGFDAGALLFFASLYSLFNDSDAASMRQRSQANEPDHNLLIVLALAIVGVIVAAVWTEILAISSETEENDAWMIGLAMVSLAMTWLFANALGAIHYAHLWYLPSTDGSDSRGLDFAGADPHPDYREFTYFATGRSRTFQVSDVTVTKKHMRRIVTVHSLLAFVFNISVIALTVSVATGVLTG